MRGDLGVRGTHDEAEGEVGEEYNGQGSEQRRDDSDEIVGEVKVEGVAELRVEDADGGPVARGGDVWEHRRGSKWIGRWRESSH